MIQADDPLASHRLFDHARVAEGYASARPYLHPEVFARVRSLLPPEARFARALDVGCGTGLSSLALRDLAGEVIGVDAATSMLRLASRASGVRYAASLGEALPFAAGSFDLVVACGAMDWIDRTRFLPRVAELLSPGGWLVPLDFGDLGRSPEIPALEGWYREVFLREYPVPPAGDPYVTAAEALQLGFGEPELHHFETTWPFTAEAYARFLMTESAVVARVEYGGTTSDDVLAWLRQGLAPLFAGQQRRLAFGGYVQLLRRS